MANLAIKGHKERGKEVIEILEMLGGKDVGYSCNASRYYYYINEYGNITGTTELPESKTFVTYTLEEFLIKKFPYKVGDKVKYINNIFCIKSSQWDSDKNTVIYYIDSDWSAGYVVETDKLQTYKEQETMERNSILTQLIEYFNNTPKDVIEREWHEYDKYNKIEPTVKEYLESVGKPKYPKDFDECCYILETSSEAYFDHDGDNPYSNDYEHELEYKLLCLRKLLICRDAYWKLAKNWKPKYESGVNNNFYCINTFNGEIHLSATSHRNVILVFPTEEMRDTFYNKFKDLIEHCKELL